MTKRLTLARVVYDVRKTKTNIEKINSLAQQAGLILMSAAATLGTVELPHHDKKVVLHAQPLFATAPILGEAPGEQLRRERDEVHPHYTSYGINQRTPARSGKA